MLSGIVLAGGKSRRMGVDKRYVMISGMKLLELSTNRLRSITEEVLFVVGKSESFITYI